LRATKQAAYLLKTTQQTVAEGMVRVRWGGEGGNRCCSKSKLWSLWRRQVQL